MTYYEDLDRYSGCQALITEQGQVIRYEDLLVLTDRIVARIKDRCLIFILCRNCFEAVAGYLGFLRIGAVSMLLDDDINDLFLNKLIENYKPEYIFMPTEKMNLNTNYVEIETFGSYSLCKTNFDIDYLLNNDLALLLTTSGSTGSQKFVRLSYKNLNNNAEAIAHYLGITDSDSPITTLPMNYSYGLSIINSHLLKGASLILTEATLMERHFWQKITDYKATTFGGVPYTYEILKKLRFEQMDIPSIKYITQAGGKLNQKLSEYFADVCTQKGIRFYVMYGQTEATARMSYLPCEYVRAKAGSIGKPIPGGAFWLEDDDLNVIQENDALGEIVYQGPNVSLGYAENCYDLSKGDENKGILRTGDIAKRDNDGFYYIVGRKNRFLKIYGNRVNLNEVEQLLKANGHECVCSGFDDNLIIHVTNPESIHEVRSCIVKYTGINRMGVTVKWAKKIPRNKSGKIIYSALQPGALDV